IRELPLGENFLRMGVTTLVLGNCGGSTLNVGEFFRELEAEAISPNVATLIGHGTVRRRAMRGSFLRAPVEPELEEMKALVRQAMEDGAVGLSTGLIYVPGVFAKTEEIVELARIAASYEGIYVTHQRSEAAKIFESLEEIFRIARDARIRAHISHIKLSGPANWGKADQVLEAIEGARAAGLDVTQDQYLYTASSTGIGQLIPEKMKDGGREKFLERLETPEVKAVMFEEMKKTLRERRDTDFAYAVIASYKANRALNGLNIVEAARQTRGCDSLDDQIETILEIEKNGGAIAVFHGMSDPDLETFMRHPNTMFASDSGVRRFNVDVPHPRGYGNSARALGLYVREKKVLRLEDAIRRMTSLPAQTFRLNQRGELREGNWADLAVFDPATVADHAVYKDPHHYATGFKYVFVNGVLAVKDDAHTGARPGMALRHHVRENALPRATALEDKEPGAAVALGEQGQ
ncbi:MAG: amidohydrolase family protein, partial [Verrucomicrobiota bacterium]|nr:amidohydrolase family protein [Verrucomicrobiota bacterium]